MEYKLKVDIKVPTLHSADGYQWFWEYMLEVKEEKAELNPGLFPFISYCLQRYPVSHSQLLQDLWVCYRLNEKRSGCFVEFGATNGILRSNTALLEKQFGWRGVLAEALPHWHAALRSNRSCTIDDRCVWTQTGIELPFFVPQDHELSTVSEFRSSDYHGGNRADGEEIMVRTVSLNDLLVSHDVPREFDYLSIDTEGSEYEILKSLDFARFRPRLITVEHNFNVERRRGTRKLLNGHGYQREFEMFSKFDDWYRLPE